MTAKTPEQRPASAQMLLEERAIVRKDIALVSARWSVQTQKDKTVRAVSMCLYVHQNDRWLFVAELGPIGDIGLDPRWK